MASLPNDYEEPFVLNGKKINTIVTYSAIEIEKQLSNFLRPSNNYQTKVIGFDAEWFLYRSCEFKFGVFARSRCATIQLCDGQTCLIIQIRYSRDYDRWIEDSAYQSLLNFLTLPNITFVGVGIKENFAKLEKKYGIVCRNAVELGPLAATAMRMPRLSYCGVDELAFLVNGFDHREHRPVTTDYNYACYPLSKELAKLATVNAYSYYMIGSTLLQSNVVCGQDVLVRLW